MANPNMNDPKEAKHSKPVPPPREPDVSKEPDPFKEPEAHYANRDQDPEHPANTTLSPPRDPQPRPAAEGFNVPPEEMLTEQEKDTSSEVPGVGPATPSEHTSGPVETIEAQGIGPRTPYPTGNPPPTREEVTRSQGIWPGDEDEPTDKPNT